MTETPDNDGGNPLGRLLSFLMAPFANLFGKGSGSDGQDAGDGGNPIWNFISNLFKSIFGLGGDSDSPNQSGSDQQPAAPAHQNWFQRAEHTVTHAVGNVTHAIGEGWNKVRETVSGWFSKNPDKLATAIKGNEVAMYVKADKVVSGKGAVGQLVLTDAEGHTETFDFKSGPWQKGALPGLLTTDNLTHANNDPNKPVTTYTIGDVSQRSDYHFMTTNQDAGFFVQLENGALSGRGDFGIHPNRNNSSGQQAGTLGCVGLDDESARRFDTILKQLKDRGVMIKSLDVFAGGQDAQSIELSRLHGNMVAKNNGKSRTSDA